MMLERQGMAVLPMGYQLGFVHLTVPDGRGSARTLLCDPLTGLLAYPSFEEYLIEHMPLLLPNGMHLAIGDVDDLKRYVTERRLDDPAMFGHLAGNECMRRVGALSLVWAREELLHCSLALLGTFGGDELIVAAAGRPYGPFLASIERLALQLRSSAPRPCSFAAATSRPTVEPIAGATAYRHLVARVDAALFDRKEALRACQLEPNGEVIDLGTLDLC